MAGNSVTTDDHDHDYYDCYDYDYDDDDYDHDVSIILLKSTESARAGQHWMAEPRACKAVRRSCVSKWCYSGVTVML
jgi:hypothetical protein